MPFPRMLNSSQDKCNITVLCQLLLVLSLILLINPGIINSQTLLKTSVHFQAGSVHLSVPYLLEKTKIFVLFVSTDILYTISIIL